MANPPNWKTQTTGDVDFGRLVGDASDATKVAAKGMTWVRLWNNTFHIIVFDKHITSAPSHEALERL